MVQECCVLGGRPLAFDALPAACFVRPGEVPVKPVKLG